MKLRLRGTPWYWTLLLLAALVFAAPSRAGTYAANASASNATTYPWIDTSSGTSLNLGDNGLSATVTIGFSFTLGTTTHTGLRIDANGTIQFGGAGTTNVTSDLPLDGNGGKPNIDAVLMPLWDDLYPDSGNVNYKLTGSAPNRVFTVTWSSAPYYCQYTLLNSLTCWAWNQTGWTGDSASFQVQLHENGKIVYRYGAVEGNGGAHGFSRPRNGGATIGIEVSNSNYTLFSRNTASISSGTTIVWSQYTPTLVSGQRYSFESYDMPGAYIRQFSPLASISALSPSSSLANRQDASFIVRPGLSNSSCWSFESVNNPGYYLRHAFFRLRLDINSTSGSYPQDATFCERAGLADSSKLSLESVNFAGYYIRHLADLTVGIGADDLTATYEGRATWSPGTALNEAVRLVARWDFETMPTNSTPDANGNYITSPDGSGNGNTLSLGSGSIQANGALGQGLKLTGAYPTAGRANGASLDTTASYTVIGWVKFNTLTACQAQAVVSQDGTTVHPFEIANLPGCGLPQSLFFEILATDSDASAKKAVYALASPAANTWYHVAGVYNATTATMAFYVNCTLQGTQTGVTTFSASGPVTVGRSRFSAGNRDYLNGSVDGVAVWQGARTAGEIATECVNMPRQLLAEYRFDESSWVGTTGEAVDSSGNGHHATAAGLSATTATTAFASPAVSANPGTCAYGVFNRSSKQYVALPGSFPKLGGSQGFTVTAWFQTTDRTQAGQRIFIDDETNNNGFILSLGDRGAGKLNFYSRKAGAGSELVTGALVADNSWYFVAITVDIDGQTKSLYLHDAAGTQLAAVSTSIATSIFASDSGIMSIGGETNAAGASENTANYGFAGSIDEVRIYQNALSSTELDAVRQLSRGCPSYGPDHLQIEHDGNGLTCTPETVTVKACADTACSSLYTSGTVTGTLSWSGAASGSSAFTISGLSGATVSVPVTAVGAMSLATSGLSPGTASGTTCLNTSTGAASCSISFADSGLLFNVPNHRADSSQTVTVTAVKKTDNSSSCTPAFANVSKAINFQCSYSNPGTGTLPVRVGGSALNAGNSASAACGSAGRAVNLSFNASGQASTTVQYADVGAMALSATYTGSGADAGLVMAGTDNFTVAPYDFAVAGVTGGKIAAGSSFSATVTARNASGNPTPNFGRESPLEAVTLGFVRTQPAGTGAVTGGFTGTLGAFVSGVASASNLAYSEVGQGNISAALSDGNYLETGMPLAGSSAGAPIWCANQNATCGLPAGSTATVYYGALGRVNVLTGRSGSVTCNNATFGDPYYGYAAKVCSYVVTGGADTAASGAATFKPHHFELALTPGCGPFTYAGQPFSASVTARNAGNSTTVNYDGSANTSPNFAQATTLAEPATPLGLGSLAGNTIAATAFAGGVASATPSYSFSAKQTAAQTLALRATDNDGVSSSGYAEGSTGLRSGRLRLSNRFGKASASLQVPVVAEYWSGAAWVLNDADNCSALAASQVALSNKRDALGNTSTASSSATVSGISGGRGTITLAAPTPAGSSLSLDLALNLGSSTTDASCLGAHPATTGGARPWLRSRNGSCAATDDRDPAARASFGLYPAETRRTVHVRDIY